MIIHKTKASTLFNVIQSKDDDSNDEDEDVINIAKKISNGTRLMSDIWMTDFKLFLINSFRAL